MPNLELPTGAGMTAAGQATLQAMSTAGITPDEPVALVGHSQGGMQAAALAHQAADFTITNVVTAGSPVGTIPVPATTALLSLEHVGDVVPAAEGLSNPTTAHHHTLRFHDLPDSTIGNHDVAAHYVAGGATVDASDHPEMLQAKADLAPFLADASSQVRTYHLTRG
jgi:pimeloyl-ACP methyl ester carboxylesterase